MPSLIGRREILDHARTQLSAGPGVLFHGSAGIGKSALLTALSAPTGQAGQAAADGFVLRCAPVEEDAKLPFVALMDLFARVPDSYVDGLAEGPRAALRAALLRGREPVSPQSRLAVRDAAVDLLRALSAAGPVLVVVDDLQWVDMPSAEVLSVALRRLYDNAPVRFLAAERVMDGEEPLGLRCCPPGTATVPVPPLADGEVADLLRERTGRQLPEHALRAIQETAAGNPLYAIELGVAALRDGMPAEAGDTLSVPPRLRDLLLDRVRLLPASARQTLLVASAAARPTLPLLTAAGIPDPAADLATAEALGVAVADAEETIRFHHPLIRAAVYADAPEHGRRAVHKLLARAVPEPVEHARHLALAHPHADETTAATLTSAAGSARRRGAPATAAELAALAARRTPADRPAERAERLLAAAEYASDAGLRADADRFAETVLAEAASAPQRVRARLIMLGNAGQALGGTGRLITDGLVEAEGHPELEARLHHWAAVRHLIGGRPAQAAAHARRAAHPALGTGPSAGADAVTADTRVAALALLARLHALHGEADAAESALDEATALLGPADEPGARELVRTRALLAADADRIDEAEAAMAGLLGRTGEYASVEETAATLVALVRIQVRSGRCREAMDNVARCGVLPVRAGSDSPPVLYAATLAETAGGRLERALELADRTVRACTTDGDQLFLLRALGVRGRAQLLAGGRENTAAAVDTLRQVRRLGETMGLGDPVLLRWYGDLAEASAILGDTDAAAEVLRAARRRAGPRPPVSVAAALERAEGLRETALGHHKRGIARIQSAVTRLRGRSLPLDLARSLIVLGAADRRPRRAAAARAALTEALEISTAVGAAPMAARARAELARTGGGRQAATRAPDYA
ncbi:AAA family ATPase [Streptomyces sp. NPDC088732]|uniref:AAA family ATPase n=1 Tax=Streptomyces sp. NPDC088732 TaxID=3365879 RepID=UPI0037F438F3